VITPADLGAPPLLLLLGGNEAQLPLLRRARALGVRVAVADQRLDTPCVREADEAVPLSSIDVDGLAAWGRERSRELRGVATATSDRAAFAAAQVAAALGLPGLPVEAAHTASNKHAMRAAFEAGAVPAPASLAARTLAEARDAAATIGYPVVMKPADNAAQRGVRRLADEGELHHHYPACVALSPSATVLVEEYADGPEFTVNTFTHRGVTHLVTLTDRVTTPPPYMGLALAHVFPSSLAAPERRGDYEVVAQAARAAVEACGLDGCPGYTQVRLTGHGPKVMETAARLGGGKDADIAQLVTGVDLYQAVLATALGQAVAEHDLRPQKAEFAAAASRYLVAPGSGRVAVAEGLDDALASPGVIEARLRFDVGDELPPPISADARRAYVLVVGDAREDVLAGSEAALARIRVLTEGEVLATS
jgi:biotin carboxylase